MMNFACLPRTISPSCTLLLLNRSLISWWDCKTKIRVHDSASRFRQLKHHDIILKLSDQLIEFNVNVTVSIMKKLHGFKLWLIFFSSSYSCMYFVSYISLNKPTVVCMLAVIRSMIFLVSSRQPCAQVINKRLFSPYSKALTVTLWTHRITSNVIGIGLGSCGRCPIERENKKIHFDKELKTVTHWCILHQYANVWYK